MRGLGLTPARDSASTGPRAHRRTGSAGSAARSGRTRSLRCPAFERRVYCERLNVRNRYLTILEVAGKSPSSGLAALTGERPEVRCVMRREGMTTTRRRRRFRRKRRGLRRGVGAIPRALRAVAHVACAAPFKCGSRAAGWAPASGGPACSPVPSGAAALSGWERSCAGPPGGAPSRDGWILTLCGRPPGWVTPRNRYAGGLVRAAARTLPHPPARTDQLAGKRTNLEILQLGMRSIPNTRKAADGSKVAQRVPVLLRPAVCLGGRFRGPRRSPSGGSAILGVGCPTN
jgi:hypothetical protein